MSSSIEHLKQQIQLVRFNPIEIQRHIHRIIPEVTNGKLDTLDPSNPFTFVIEAACTLAASNMAENAANNRKAYAGAATSKQELYRHMSDKDLVDIFALPAETTMIFGFSREELEEAMVPVYGTEIRKLVIPRNTTVEVSNLTFSLQYPIEIRRMGHGGIQVVWDTEVTSPLLNIETNLIPSQFITAGGVEMLMFTVPMKQFTILSTTDTVSLARKFSTTITIDDKYYFCRVWNERGANNWVEIPITYSQEIYPSYRPTATVLVDGKQITVEIPIVYLKNQMISGKIRVDIYQTKGPLTADLSNYDYKQFVAKWNAIDKSEMTDFVAPLKNIRTSMIYSTSPVTGGQEEMTFQQLQERVISNGYGHPILPITPAQAQSRLERNGYNIVKNIDNVTDRIFKATRAMPAPEDSNLITAAAAGIHTLTDTIERLVTLSTVYENAKSITISPDTMYKLQRGLISVVSDAERQVIDSLPGDKRAELITQGSYFFSPFHYVLDTSSDLFAVRKYYLDDPVVNYRTFVSENDTTMLQVSVGSHLIQRASYGWDLYVTTASSQAWRDLMHERVFATIGYSPDRTGVMAYIRGELQTTLQNGEQVWKFPIHTTYDINDLDEVEISNSSMYEPSQQMHRASLTEDFDIFFSTTEPMPNGWNPSTFDQLIGNFLVDPGAVGVTRERLNITLGHALTNLWARARSVVSEANYERYEEDVQAVFEQDVYRRDPVTGVATYQIVNGQIVFDILHRAGDPKVDSENNPVYKYFKGDIRRDANGAPILKDPRRVSRQFDLFVLEAPYFLATTETAKQYVKRIISTLVQWVTSDLGEINRSLLDKTQIFYAPVQSVGEVEVIYGAGLRTTIAAGQYFDLKLFVRDSVYKNEELKEKLRKTTVSTIAKALEQKTVSTSGIIDVLRDAYGDDVISFEITGLGGTNNLSLCTMVDDSSRLTLRKRLVYRVDQTFSVEEDVDVEFISHERAGVQLR